MFNNFQFGEKNIKRNSSFSILDFITCINIAPSGLHSMRVVLDTDVATENKLELSYELLSAFLAQYNAMADILRMPPSKMLVFLTITVATLYKAKQRGRISDGAASTCSRDAASLGFISRRAIAASTGLPRENVRRIVKELEQGGLLVLNARGSVANKSCLSDGSMILQSTNIMPYKYVSLIEYLINSKVIGVYRKIDHFNVTAGVVRATMVR